MAIKIPSKSIYSVENPKIRDNIINNIQVSATNVVPNNDYEIVVYNESLDVINNVTQETSNDNSKSANTLSQAKFSFCSAGNIIINKYITIDIIIKKEKINSYISKLYKGKKKDSGENYTQISKFFQETIYEFEEENGYTHTANYDDYEKFGGYFNFNTIINSSSSKKILKKETSSNIYNKQVTFSSKKTEYEFVGVYDFDNSVVDLQNENININTITNTKNNNGEVCNALLSFNVSETNLEKIDFKDFEDYFKIEGLKVFVGRTIYSCGTGFIVELPSQPNKVYKCKVVEIEQNVVKADLTIYGDIIGIDLEDFSLQVGSGNKPFKVDNNELMQTTNFLSSTNENALERQYTNLLEQYKHGKETAVIDCSISEYKDQDGNVVINPKTSDKMIFEMYDIVIPYKQGFVNGVQQDVPLSKYPNGEPKQFQVLGVKPHTNGVLRQELTLQEISQSTLQNK